MEKCINITFFVDPQQFWFRRAQSRVSSKWENVLLEEINMYCAARYNGEAENCYQPAVGEIVAAYDAVAKKWTRNRVLEAATVGGEEPCRTYYVWSLDEGIPKKLTGKYVHPLPDKFTFRAESRVKQGAIRNLLPAHRYYDPDEERVCNKLSAEWEQAIIAALKSLIDSAERVYFENITFHTIVGEEIQLGELRFLTKQQKIIDAASIILSVGPAIPLADEQFLKHMSSKSSWLLKNIPLDVNNEGTTSPRSTKLDESVDSSMNESYACSEDSQASSVSSIQSRTILAKLRRISKQHHPAKTNPQRQDDQCMHSIGRQDVLLKSKECLRQATKPCRSPLVNLLDLNSSLTLEALIDGALSVDTKPESKLFEDSEPIYNVTSVDAELKQKLFEDSEPIHNVTSVDAELEPKLFKNSEPIHNVTSVNAELEPKLYEDSEPIHTVTSVEAEATPTPHASYEQTNTNKSDTKPIPELGAQKQQLPSFLHRKLLRLNQMQTKSKANVERQSASQENSHVSLNVNSSSVDSTQVTEGENISSNEMNIVHDVVSEDITDEQLPRPPMKDNFLPPINTIQSRGDVGKFDMTLWKEQQSALEELRHHRILVHGESTPPPIRSIAEVNFYPDIHQALDRLGIRKVYRLQAYTWPHILRGNSVVCVNSAATGKTYSFLPALCSLVRMLIEESLVSSEAGPVAIIVCYSTMEVQRIAHLCRRLLNTVVKKQMSVVECYGVRLVNQVCNTLFAGCAILVTTVPAYRRVYEAMPEVLVRKRIQIVAIDNIERMMPYFSSDILLLCKNCDKPGLQMIVTAGHWHVSLVSFFMRYKNMIMCIGAYLEAAVYAKVQFLLRLRRDDGSKQCELAKYIREHDYRNQRTVVFASTARDLDPIVETLKKHSIKHLVCSDKSIVSQHDAFRHWDELLPGYMKVLVVLDDLLEETRVSKAQHIIHYTLSNSWTCFTRRFAASFNYYVPPYVKGKDPENSCDRPSTLVLLDENNNEQLPKLIDFLELHHVKFPENLSKVAQNLRKVSEKLRIMDWRAVYDLCPQLLALASCRNFRSCIYRHVLMVNDLAGDELPASGTVRLNICHVFSPVHFAARLEAVRQTSSPESWKTLCDPKKFLLHDIRMQAFFANVDRHQMYGKEVTRNDLCAIFHEQNYRRCRIIHFEAEGGSTTVGNVQLKLIDTGRILHSKTANLLCLPEQFRTLPGQTIDVRIAGVVPHDFEEDWDKKSTELVQRWIEGHVQQPNHYVQGKVVLALREMIWVDELRLTEQLDTMKTAVVSTKIKSSLVSKQYGILDKDSFERIQQLVQACKLNKDSQPASESPSHADEPHPVIQASLDTSLSTTKSYPTTPTPSDSSTSRRNCEEDDDEVASKRSLDFFTNIKPRKEETNVHSNQCTGQWMPSSTSRTEAKHTLGEAKLTSRNDDSMSSTSSFEVLSPIRGSVQPPVVTTFDKLKKGMQYLVIIGRYISPDLFYVYRKDIMAQIDRRMAEFMTKESKPKLLADVQVWSFCLLYLDDLYCRCQIVEVTETGIVGFLLDFGGTMACDRESMFEIPTELLRDLPFAAIEASLGLIAPMQGSSWTEEAGNAIYDNVLVKYNREGMVAHILKELDPSVQSGSTDQPIECCHRYELLLAALDSMDPYGIISELAQDQLAMIDSRLCNQEGNAGWGELGAVQSDNEGCLTADEEAEPFVQVNFTPEEVRAVLSQFSKEQSLAVTAAAAAIDKESHVTKDSRSVVSQCDERAKQTRTGSPTSYRSSSKSIRKYRSRQGAQVKEAPLPPLKCDYRIPPTVWRQDDYFVVLYVSAPEVSRYQLTVQSQSLLLQFIRDDQRYLLPLNLFGPIDPRHTAHEIRGLAIVIRLARLPGSTWRWPTLLNHSGKLPWLRESIDLRRKQRHLNSDDSGTETDDEEQPFGMEKLPPVNMDAMTDYISDNSQEIDDFGLQQDDAMEDDLFYPAN